MIKYLGSKRLLLPKIVAAVSAFRDCRTVADLFSGTARVGHALKREGFHVRANDHLAYATTLARCYVQADRERLERRARALLTELSELPPRPGYFTETFCEQSRFFRRENGARIDAIRERIAELDLEPELQAVALTSLMEAADRVDSTTGVQMAYLKRWAPRAYNPLQLRMPELLPGGGEAMQRDVLELAPELDTDVAYLDPPYNQHSYLGNYHVWETLVRWDAPATYGVACKRVQCRQYSSDFNRKRRIHAALEQLVTRLPCKHLVVSFNNEGHVSREEMEELLASRGHVGVAGVDFKRYVGAQIGIHNPKGDRVGRVSHLRNKEYLYVVSKDRDAVERALGAIADTDKPGESASEARKPRRLA
jgi:adenine-specific DNA-methyltransferase